MTPVAAPARARRAQGSPSRTVVPVRVPPTDRHDRSTRPKRDAPTRPNRDSPTRPKLRVVTDARVVAQRRRRRLRAALLVTSAALAGSLFALAAFHAMLASGQAQLDHLSEQVADAQGRYESLRLDVAELEAPSRIVREAQERLGMVPPPAVTYLTPSQAVSDEVGQAATEDSLTSGDTGDRAAWATVKPYLSGRP